MEIRTFAESDRDELRELSRYAGSGAPTASLWGHFESESAVYLEPYMDFEPGSLFLAVRDNRLVGYLAGSLGGTGFPSESKRMEEAIRQYRLVFRAKPAAFFARSMIDMITAAIRRQPTAGEIDDPRWPAHLHINVAADARGTGAADGLMVRWFEHLRESESPGCHLQTLVENARAVRFFQRMGFVQHGATPVVPGLRYAGKRVHQQTMVWSA